MLFANSKFHFFYMCSDLHIHIIDAFQVFSVVYSGAFGPLSRQK